MLQVLSPCWVLSLFLQITLPQSGHPGSLTLSPDFQWLTSPQPLTSFAIIYVFFLLKSLFQASLLMITTMLPYLLVNYYKNFGFLISSRSPLLESLHLQFIKVSPPWNQSPLHLFLFSLDFIIHHLYNNLANILNF